MVTWAATSDSGGREWLGWLIGAVMFILVVVIPARQQSRNARKAAARRERSREWDRYGGPYGEHHQAERRRWAVIIAAEGARCSERECIMPSRAIEKGAAAASWDLGHDHESGGVADYLGPVHKICNQYEGLLRRKREGRPPWPGAPTLEELRAKASQARRQPTAPQAPLPSPLDHQRAAPSPPPRQIAPSAQRSGAPGSADLGEGVPREGATSEVPVGKPSPESLVEPEVSPVPPGAASPSAQVMDNSEYVREVMRVAGVWERSSGRKLQMPEIHALRRDEHFIALIDIPSPTLREAADALRGTRLDPAEWLRAVSRQQAEAELAKERLRVEQAGIEARQAAAREKALLEFARPGEDLEQAAERMALERKQRAEKQAREWQINREFSRETER